MAQIITACLRTRQIRTYSPYILLLHVQMCMHTCMHINSRTCALTHQCSCLTGTWALSEVILAPANTLIHAAKLKG